MVPLTEALNRLLERGQYADALLHVECLLLDGSSLDETWVQRLPGSIARQSPLLMKALGERMLFRGSLLHAIDAIYAAVKGFAQLNDLRQLVHAFSLLAIAHMRAGNTQDAVTALTFLQDELKGGEDPSNGFAALALAIGSHLLPSGTTVEDPFERALRCWKRSDRSARYVELGVLIAEDLCLGVWLMDRVPWDRRLQAVRPYLMKHIDLAPLEPLLQAAHALRQERYEDAIAVLNGYRMDRVDGSRLNLYAALFRGQALIRHRPDLAEAEWPSIASKFVQVEADLEMSFVYACTRWMRYQWRGENEQAAALMRSLEALAAQGLRPSFALLAQKLKAAGKGVEPDALEAHKSGGWKVRCFGELAFIERQTEVKYIQWKRKKARELLVYLLLQPRYSTPKEKLCEALFSGYEPDKMSNQLYVAIHQLKQILYSYLGEEHGVTSKDGIVSLREGMISYVDVERYTALVRIADQLWASDREAAVEMMEDACLIYDEIVPDMQYADWLDAIREVLSERHSGVLRRLGQWALEQRRLEEAEGYFREWIMARPQQEEAYQGMLRVLVAAGRNAEARHWYAMLEKQCREELGTEPLEETKAMIGMI